MLDRDFGAGQLERNRKRARKWGYTWYIPELIIMRVRVQGWCGSRWVEDVHRFQARLLTDKEYEGVAELWRFVDDYCTLLPSMSREQWQPPTLSLK